MPFPREDVVEQLAALREGPARSAQDRRRERTSACRAWCARRSRRAPSPRARGPAEAPPRNLRRALPRNLRRSTAAGSRAEAWKRPPGRRSPKCGPAEVLAERLEPAVHATQEFAGLPIARSRPTRPPRAPRRCRVARRAGRLPRPARAPVRGGQGTAQDQRRRRPRPAADLPRRGEGDHSRGERGRAALEGGPVRPCARGRPAAPPAHAQGQRAHDGPHAPGRARPRARGADHRDRRGRIAAGRRSSTRSRSASTASRSPSSGWRAARTSSRPSRSRCRSARCSSSRRTSPPRSR